MIRNASTILLVSALLGACSGAPESDAPNAATAANALSYGAEATPAPAASLPTGTSAGHTITLEPVAGSALFGKKKGGSGGAAGAGGSAGAAGAGGAAGSAGSAGNGGSAGSTGGTGGDVNMECTEDCIASGCQGGELDISFNCQCTGCGSGGNGGSGGSLGTGGTTIQTQSL